MNKHILVALFLMMVSFTWAQKVGHINANDVVKQLPEAQKADKEIMDLVKKHETQLQKLVKEYEIKVKLWESEAKSKTPQESEKRRKEIQDMERNIESYRQKASTEVMNKRQEAFPPIINKIQQAINSVAKSKGIDYVLDASPDKGILYFNQSLDLLPDVKKALGIK